MKKFFSVLLVLVFAVIPMGAISASADSKDSKDITINVFNWGEYLADGSDGTMDINSEFTKRTGIKVNYSNFSHNEEMYTKLKSGGVSYDVIIPSDYMVAQLIEEDMLWPLNFDNIPNYKYIDEQYKNLSYDKENKYSVPYTWGVVGIFYNSKYVTDPVDSWDILWDSKYKGKVLMFSNPRDAFGISLIKNGFSLNTNKKEEWETAAEDLTKQREQVNPSYVMDEIFDKMLNNEAYIAPYYNGDGIRLLENPDIKFAVPKEGTNFFVDAMCIPKSSTNREAAEAYINFLADPEIAAANFEYLGYPTPNKGAFDLLSDEDKENETLFPDSSIIQDKSEMFLNLPKETRALQEDLWTRVITSNDHNHVWIVIASVVIVLLLIGFIIFRKVQKKKEMKLDDEE